MGIDNDTFVCDTLCYFEVVTGIKISYFQEVINVRNCGSFTVLVVVLLYLEGELTVRPIAIAASHKSGLQ